MNIDKIIDNVIAAEKGFVDHPNDRGGPTNFGITQAVARANGFHGHMRDLPISFARKIYRDRYIVIPRFDKIIDIDADIGEELVDTGVNMGPSRAAEFLQRWLNGFNNDGSRYADLFVDGRLGPLSFAALKAFLNWRGQEGRRVLYNALNCTQGARYLQITEDDRSQRDFLYGWMRARTSFK